MYKNKLIVVAVLFVVALFTRTFWLDKIPTGITNDELHFVLNAKAVYYGFTDMSGIWNPLSLTTIPDNPSAELTSPFLAPFVGPFDLNLFTTRFIFAVLSSLLVVIIYLIAYEINPVVGLISGIATIINPWFFYMGRIAFDMPLAMFFLTLTFYSLIKLKNNWIFLALIPCLLGFYTYIGTKVIFIPYMAGMLLFGWYINQKKYAIKYLIIFGICLLATAHYGYNIISGPSRMGELITPFSPQITAQVEAERNQSIPFAISRLLINRYTIYTNFFVQKYLNNFSPNILFTKGDETYLLSFWKHGYFYFIDIVIILIGGYYLYHYKRKWFWIILWGVILSPIPEAIRRDTIPAYSFHSCLQYPFLIIFNGTGIYFVIKQLPKLKWLIGLIYLILFINLWSLYFYRYPIYQPEGFGLSNRVLANYINYEKRLGKQITVATNEPSSLFRQYLFYTKQYTKDNFEIIKKLYQQNREDITFDGVRFTSEKTKDNPEINMVYITQTNFHQIYIPRLSIKQLVSGQEMYSIYNSKLCLNKKRPVSPQMTVGDFAVEKLSLATFCDKFIFSD